MTKKKSIKNEKICNQTTFYEFLPWDALVIVGLYSTSIGASRKFIFYTRQKYKKNFYICVYSYIYPLYRSFYYYYFFFYKTFL